MGLEKKVYWLKSDPIRRVMVEERGIEPSKIYLTGLRRSMIPSGRQKRKLVRLLSVVTGF